MSQTTQETSAAVTVRQEADRVWIDGIKGFGPHEYASSVQGAQAIILQVLGEQITYDDLVCYGSFAFRTEVHSGLCPSAGHPYCGFTCVHDERVIPWQVTQYGLDSPKAKEDRAAFEREVRAAIKASIDRGIPVHYGSEEDGLIIGYADDGARWLCLHPYHKGGTEPFWHDEAAGFAGGSWPWGVAIWQQPKPADDRMPARDATIAALRQAVEMWKTEKQGDYYCGDAAYQFWIQWLNDVNAGKVADAKGGMQGNGWCFDVLVQNRRIAARWLRQQANLFDGEAANQLRRAADHYAKIPDICLAGVSCSWDLAPQPGRYEQWTPQMRTDQANRLATARAQDRAAVAAIEKALEQLSQPSAAAR